MLRKIFFLGCTLFFGGSFASAQLKKEIVPMHSSCEDVKKIFSNATCRKSYDFLILQNDSYEIEYSLENCQKAFGKKWNIPIGTVLSFTRIFKIAKPINDFEIDVNKCIKTSLVSDIPNETIYSCEEYGTEFTVAGNLVTSITYIPTPKDECLLCK